MTDPVKPPTLSTSEAGASQQQGSEPHDLQRREEALAEREIEMALSEAQLRGQEAHVAALGTALSTRGAWIDGQVDQIAAWASRAGVDAAHMLHGLGGGAATQEADLKRYVQRSETLLIGRAAMIATRAEVLQRRAEQLADRASELQAFEQAFVRAEVRLTARERLLREALSGLQRTASGDVAPKLEPTPAAADTRSLDAPRHRHAQTVSMSAAENDVLNAAVTHRKGSAPPVLDFSSNHIDWSAPTKPLVDGRTRPSAQVAAVEAAALTGTLHLAGHALTRSAVEVDRTSQVVLASLDELVHLSGRVDLVSKNAHGEAQCFPVRVQLVMPGSDGVGSAVVLSAGTWSAADFDDFEAVLALLP